MNGGYDSGELTPRAQACSPPVLQVGEIVMVGVIDRELDHNDSHASQVSEKRL